MRFFFSSFIVSSIRSLTLSVSCLSFPTPADPALTYQWGSAHWHATTWNKVRILNAVYAMGFHVIQSDIDVSWLRDPTPYFMSHLNASAQLLVSTDDLRTQNPPGDSGMEVDNYPWESINSGQHGKPLRVFGIKGLNMPHCIYCVPMHEPATFHRC